MVLDAVRPIPIAMVSLCNDSCNPSRQRLSLDLRNAGTQQQLTVMHSQPSGKCSQHGEIGAVDSDEESLHPFLQNQLRAGFHTAFFEFNDASSLASYFVTTAIAKAHSAIWPRFVAGVMAGLFVTLGATFALVAAGGIDPITRAASPAIPKLITGLTFPIALLLIMFVGGDLFTGNCMTVGLGWFTGNITIRQGANLLFVSFWSNLCGCLFFSYFLTYRAQILLAEPYNSWLLSVAEGKLALDWGVVVLRGIGANTLVCIAIFMGSSSRQALGRFVIGWIPVLVFSVIGYEHVVADFVFIPVALMYGGTTFSTAHYIVWNIVPAALGNLIGGCFLVGGFLSYLYVWRERPYMTWESWLRYNFLPEKSFREIVNETAHQFLHDLIIRNAVNRTVTNSR